MTCCAPRARTHGAPTSLSTTHLCRLHTLCGGVHTSHFMVGFTQMCGRDGSWGITCCRVLTPRAMNNFPVLET